MGQTWLFTTEHDTADLATYLRRAKRLDADAKARLVSRDTMLAVYVCPVSGGGGPTVLGLRVFRLAEPEEQDVVVPVEALLDRLARAENGLRLPIPPMQASAPWAGVSPPHGGWQVVGILDPAELDQVAQGGINEIAAGAGTSSAAAAVAQLRAAVWGRPIPFDEDDLYLPAGAAFAASALGFLTGDLTLHVCGPWTRLTGRAGYVLSRPPML